MFSFFVTEPLYNALVTLIELFPSLDLGLVIILFTIIVKLILFPLSLKAIKAQQKLKEVEPDLKDLKEKYKDDREQLAMKTLELYRERNIKPFSGLFLMLIQIPIIFGLYYVFLRSGLPAINTDLLYSFVPVPDHDISTLFLGLIDVTKKSLPLALLAGVFQYFQTRLSMPDAPKSDERSFGADFARSLSFQMKYIFPIIIIFISYTLNAATAIYFSISSLFHIFQELYVKHSRQKEAQLKA